METLPGKVSIIVDLAVDISENSFVIGRKKAMPETLEINILHFTISLVGVLNYALISIFNSAPRRKT